MPLLVRGARQVGKTYLVEDFGQRHFSSCVTINFEQHPDHGAVFDSLVPKQILSSLEAITKQPIELGKTLLFLDEIQECPKAILALRYFKEQLPELHVIGAGSLLEFVLHNANFRMPVGRVEFLHLRPLSFLEFLSALGYEALRQQVEQSTLGNPLSNPLHNQLLDLVRLYWIVGGMPASVKAYSETESLVEAQDLQTALLTTYRHDFGKYAARHEFRILETFFARIPNLIAQWFKYVKVDPSKQAREIKAALEHLTEAHLLNPICTTSASGLTLAATMNPRKFKLLFLDIGLISRACQLDLNTLQQTDLVVLNKGQLAEQFVGQELIAYAPPHEMHKLFSWVREKKGSSAEVDFVVPLDSQIIPIEVKAGATGRLKSLHLFLEEKKLSTGVRISTLPLRRENSILTVPFYMISQLGRLIHSEN